jgi:hypothetical protein
LKKSYEITNEIKGSDGFGECPAFVGFENEKLFWRGAVMIFLEQQKFLLGEISVSPAALRALDVDTICRAIDAHVCGDFKVVESKFFSVFRSQVGIEFCVSTSATVTTVFLAGEH